MTKGNGGFRCILEERGKGSSHAVDILHYLDRRERVLSNKFFEFISMSLFEVEGRGSSVGVANGNNLEIDINGEVVGAQTWEDAPFTYGS